MTLKEWIGSDLHMPRMMRDFHAQKDCSASGWLRTAIFRAGALATSTS